MNLMSLSSAASAQPPNEEWKKSTNPVDQKKIVSKLANGNSFNCKYCAKQFNGSATRCYVHLTGEGTRVAKCTECPKETVLSLTAEQAKRKPRAARSARSLRRTNAGATAMLRLALARAVLLMLAVPAPSMAR
jgi:hypothetical protein